MNGEDVKLIPVRAWPPGDHWDARVTGATAMTADRFVGQLYQEIKGGR